MGTSLAGSSGILHKRMDFAYFRNLEILPGRPAKTGKQYTPLLVLAIKNY